MKKLKMSRIKFVRTYKVYNTEYMDIIYESGRVRTVGAEDAPQTAKTFIVLAGSRTEQYDKVFKRDEVIYQ